MSLIEIFPDRFNQFGSKKNNNFYLITNSRLSKKFVIHENSEYQNYQTITYDPEENFINIIKEQIPNNSHILVIAPDCYFRSPKPKDLGQNKKLCVMACNSTSTSEEAIKHFLNCAEKTNPYEQDKIAQQFFINCESTEILKLVDEEYDTYAEFHHLNEKLQWHEQIGEIDWGGQQLFPSGEISVLPLEIFTSDLNNKINVNGQIALKGIPIVHSGLPSFLLEDRERIFRALSNIQKYALIAELEQGIITEIKPSHSSVELAADMLTAMCEIDSRYRMIIEIGFGINYNMQIFPGNCAMNEVYSNNSNGTVHFGLGLTPHTQYHLDIICPSLKVFGKENQLIFG